MHPALAVPGEVQAFQDLEGAGAAVSGRPPLGVPPARWPARRGHTPGAAAALGPAAVGAGLRRAVSCCTALTPADAFSLPGDLGRPALPLGSPLPGSRPPPAAPGDRAPALGIPGELLGALARVLSAASITAPRTWSRGWGGRGACVPSWATLCSPSAAAALVSGSLSCPASAGWSFLGGWGSLFPQAAVPVLPGTCRSASEFPGGRLLPEAVQAPLPEPPPRLVKHCFWKTRPSLLPGPEESPYLTPAGPPFSGIQGYFLFDLEDLCSHSGRPPTSPISPL